MATDVPSLLNETEDKMKRRLEAFRSDISTLRAGRATPSLVERIKVDYYGTRTPMNQLANISAPESRVLVIKPYDQNVLEDVEKAILKSDLGLTPDQDGELIRLTIPQLTEERRNELVKKVRDLAEEARVGVRNIRRDTNDRLKHFMDAGDISEDSYHRYLSQVQELTDQYTDKIDTIFDHKKSDIMTV